MATLLAWGPAGGLLLSTIGVFLAITGWLWLCAGFQKAGWRRTMGGLALQLSAICLLYGLLRGQPMVGVFTALFPPLGVVEVMRAGHYLAFLSDLATGVAPYALAMLVLCLAWRPLRRWSLVLTSAVAMLAALFVGDQISQAAMCATAAKRGFDHFDRTSFANSLTFARGPNQFNIHAKAQSGGQTLSWTYSAMDWNLLPTTVAQNVRADQPFTCPAAPKP